MRRLCESGLRMLHDHPGMTRTTRYLPVSLCPPVPNLKRIRTSRFTPRSNRCNRMATRSGPRRSRPPVCFPGTNPSSMPDDHDFLRPRQRPLTRPGNEHVAVQQKSPLTSSRDEGADLPHFTNRTTDLRKRLKSGFNPAHRFLQIIHGSRVRDPYSFRRAEPATRHKRHVLLF